MNIALCYESVLPQRGGCEHYISALANRLVSDGHAVHLYASRWDSQALSERIHFHRIPTITGPRFLRPWRFGYAVEQAIARAKHDLSIGFDKTWGQDILYPQGGLHIASAEHNILKHSSRLGRISARIVKKLDFAHHSFLRLERKQYLAERRPVIVVNSRMVQRHFEKYYDIPAEEIVLLPSAINTHRLLSPDRFKIRAELHEKLGIQADEPVGLFVATNYRLKGLAPLIRTIAHLDPAEKLKVLVVGNSKTKRYELLAKKWKVENRIHFAGFQSSPQAYFFSADFLLHPTFYDPCSLVVLEAISCGLPILTTQYNGAGELLQLPGDQANLKRGADSNSAAGMVIQDPHNHLEFAQAIRQFINPQTRSIFARNLKSLNSRYTFENHYQQLLSLFLQVANQRRVA